MALTPEEIAEARERIRAELEQEHARRLAEVRRKRDKARRKRTERAEREREIALARLREEEQARFYQENGYKLYTDSTGREVWLTPEEYEMRMRRRRHRRKRRIYEPAVAPKGRVIVFYVGAFILAVIIGIVLSR